MHFIRTALLCSVAISSAMASASTPVPTGGLLQLNTPATAADARPPSITGLGNGGFAAIWGYNTTPRARFSDSAGNLIGAEIVVGTNTTKSASIAGLNNGNVIAAWECRPASITLICGRLYDNSGTALGSEFVLYSSANDNAQIVSVAALTGGGFVATWRNNGASSFDIYARRFDGNGNPATNAFRVPSNNYYMQNNPSVVGLSDGGYVIVWESNLLIGQDENIHGQRYDASDSPIGGEFIANTTTTGRQMRPSVAKLASGGFVVAWEGQEFDAAGNTLSYYDINFQRFNSGATPIGSETRANAVTTNSQTNASTTHLNDGGFVAIWYTSQVAPPQAHGQRFDANGLAVGSTFVANQGKTNAGWKSVTTLGNGDIMPIWLPVPGNGTGIFSHRFSIP